MSGTAHGEQGGGTAQVTTPAQCDALWRRADEVAAQGRHREAADLFVQLYTDYHIDCPTFDGHGPDEVLSRSASLFEQDRRYGAAIHIRRRLMSEYGAASAYAKSHPGGSPHAERAIYEIAHDYESIFVFTKAATSYEEFSRESSSDPLAPVALGKAISLRIALGQLDEALTNVEAFIKTHGRGREHHDAVGEVTLDIAELAGRAGQWKTAEVQLQRFLRRPAKSTSKEHDIVVLSLHGLSLWKQGEDHRGKALKSFAQAVAIAEQDRRRDSSLQQRLGLYRQMIASDDAAPALGSEELNVRMVRLVDAIGGARFYVAEGARSQCEAIRMPQLVLKNRLSPKVKSWWLGHIGPAKAREWEKRLKSTPPDERRVQIGSVQYQHWVDTGFRPWLERKEEASKRAESLYLAAIDEDVPEWEVAAAYRIGELAESIMTSLHRAPVDPSFANDRELIDIYRDALDSAATPYRAYARRSYEHCLSLSTREKLSNDWSRACVLHLNALDPRDFQLGDPLVGEPTLHDNTFALPQKLLRPE